MKYYMAVILALSPAMLLSQSFKFSYTTTGLGSNRYSYPHLTITISDTLFSWFVYKKLENKKEAWSFMDTTHGEKCFVYETSFKTSSRDSILNFLKGKEGKYIFNTNPHIMSGGIQQFYISNEQWCTEFSLKNTFDSTALSITNIINDYLPADNKINIPYTSWKDRNSLPLIEKCQGAGSDKTYFEILKDEYELIRKNKNK